MALSKIFHNKRRHKYHNAKFESVSGFVNRKEEIGMLQERIFNGRRRIINIRGEGGVGKTTLVQYFIQFLLKESTDCDNLHSIVYLTAKPDELRVKKNGVTDVLSKKGYRKNNGFFCESLDEILKKILHISGHPDFISTSYFRTPYYDVEVVLKWLKKRRILLVIDDLDHFENYLEILSFIDRFPYPGTVLISTRKDISKAINGVVSLPLNPLGKEHVRELINQKIEPLEDYQKNTIIDIAMGNPLYTIVICESVKVAIKEGKNIDNFLGEFRFNRPSLKFLFNDLIEHLHPDAKRLILALCILKKKDLSIDKVLLQDILKISSEKIDYRLNELELSSLVDRDKLDNDDFDIHNLLIEYTLNIDKNDTDFYTRLIEDLISYR